MIKVIGKQGVLLTDQEFQCYRYARRLRQRALWRKIYSVHRILWPELLDSVDWSPVLWRKLSQLAVLMLVWPLIVVWGLAVYLLALVQFPFKLFQTWLVPDSLRAPGEKTLMGIHNAFSSAIDLSQADYIECIDGWVSILFGATIALDKNLSIYLLQVSSERKDIDHRTGAVAEGLRSNLSVAREYLSRDLGHYLSNGHSRRNSPQQSV
ncbi:MAG: hypothetical protein ACRBBW_12825 [Cellvibrionaceae bacterium]